jgi:acyl-CoA thioester hydrolase
MKPRKTGQYFEREPGAPPPLTVRLDRRVAFNEVDVMGIAWHGRYAVYFEEASTEIRRRCGLTYEAFRDAAIHAPIVELRVDYKRPVFLDEQITVKAALIWTDAARLNTEYRILKQDGSLAATGSTVQLFTEAATGEPYMASPELLETCRENWREGRL